MATSIQFMNARGDADLLARLVATAEQHGVENASQWVQANMARLVNTTVDGTQTIADVFAYADEVRKSLIESIPERPGMNLGAVTDLHLKQAVESAITATGVI